MSGPTAEVDQEALLARLTDVTSERADLLAERDHIVTKLRAAGTPVTHIARAAGISRQAVYDITTDS